MRRLEFSRLKRMISSGLAAGHYLTLDRFASYHDGTCDPDRNRCGECQTFTFCHSVRIYGDWVDTPTHNRLPDGWANLCMPCCVAFDIKWDNDVGCLCYDEDYSSMPNWVRNALDVWE